jgi:hypothetical protein
MAHDVEHNYAELRAKHQLPDFALLDREFEISSIEKPQFLLRSIRRKISERLDSLTQLLDPLIQPDAGSYVHLNEYRALTEGDRRELMKQFQHVMELYLACIDAELSANDAQDAKLIARAAAEWPQIRESIRPFVQKVAAMWTRSTEHKDHVGYFG